MDLGGELGAAVQSLSRSCRGVMHALEKPSFPARFDSFTFKRNLCLKERNYFLGASDRQFSEAVVRVGLGFAVTQICVSNVHESWLLLEEDTGQELAGG